MNLALRQKGFTAIGGVLIVQLIALSVFVWQIENAQSNSPTSMHSLSAIQRSNWLAAMLSASTLSCIAYAVTGDYQCHQIYQHGKDAIIAEMNELSPEFNDNPEQRSQADQATSVITSLIHVLDETASEKPLPHNERMIQLVRLELLPSWTELYSLHDRLVTGQERKLREASEGTSHWLLRNLAWLIAIQSLSTCALAYLFNKLLKQHPQLDAERTLAKEKQPPAQAPHSSGGSRLFQSVSETKAAALEKKFRQFETISTDMHSSLASVQDALESVIEDNEDDLPEPAQLSLNHAHAQVAKLLKQLHDLGLHK